MRANLRTSAPGSVFLATALLTVAGCSRLPASPSTHVPEGLWGGQHAGLTVSDSGAAVELDCAHGVIDGPIPLDEESRFDVGGTFVLEAGGPLPPDVTPDEQRADYTGSVNDSAMTLTVTLTRDGEVVGTFDLALNQTPRLLKCL